MHQLDKRLILLCYKVKKNRETVRFVISVLISVAVLTSASVLAHHDAVTSGFLYNADVLVEVEGEITEVFWRNPHT